MSNAVADALSEGKADVNDIVKIVKDVVEQSKLEMPARLVGFDPETITIDDCKMLTAAMFNAGKLTEMKYPPRPSGRDDQDRRKRHGHEQDRLT